RRPVLFAGDWRSIAPFLRKDRNPVGGPVSSTARADRVERRRRAAGECASPARRVPRVAQRGIAAREIRPKSQGFATGIDFAIYAVGTTREAIRERELPRKG